MIKIHDLLMHRWSPRAFSNREIEKDKLLTLFEAARWAPSCFNEQPWSFIVGRRGQGKTYDGLLKCLIEFNQSWAASAPVLILNVARKNFARNRKANLHAWYDVGQAMANLLVEATYQGLMVHQMAGFDSELARTKFKIPDEFEPVAAAALGYLGYPAILPQGVEEKAPDERKRKPLDTFVFGTGWGNPFADL